MKNLNWILCTHDITYGNEYVVRCAECGKIVENKNQEDNDAKESNQTGSNPN